MVDCFRRGWRPGLDDFHRAKTKEGKPRELEVEPKITRDLGERPAAIELRRKLRFGHGEAQVLDAFKSVSGVSRNPARIVGKFVDGVLVLDKTECRQGPRSEERRVGKECRSGWC